jgi:hypothetical protein
MLMYFLGDDYIMDEIRVATGAQWFGEEFFWVQPLVGSLDVPKNSHGHVHSPP